MSEILYIENKQVDIIPNSIHRTLQINNIGEAKDRQANYSNRFKLPKTSVNVKTFDYLGVSGNQSLSPYRKLRCDYTRNGIPLVINGYAIVKATNTFYEVVIYDGIIDLAERVKGKKINELDYSDLNHYLTQVTYENSLSNTEGYIYAIGEFIPRPVFSTIRIEEQAPCLFVKTIWDKIWNESGLRYSGSFFSENEDFQTEVISPEKGYTVENIELTSTNLGSGQTDIISRIASSNDPLLSFEDQHIFESNTYTGVTKNQDGTITINENAQFSFNIVTDYTNVDSYVNLRVLVNGSIKSSIVLETNGSPKTTNINLTLSTGDIIAFILVGTYDFNQVENSTYNINYSASSVIEITKQTGGQFIDFSTFTSKIDQLAFIKDVMQRYGLILKPIKNTSIYEFIQFETLLNDKATAKDWSSKLNEIKSEKYDIQYARENEAIYSYPEEIVDHVYDGTLLIDNENAALSKKLFSSPFQIATKRGGLFRSQQVYQVHIWEEKEEDGITIKTIQETPVKLFRISRIDDNITTLLFDNANSITVSGLIPFLSLDNIQMQYFLNKNYKAFGNLINRTKQLETSFLLTELDIYNLDFFRLKYLKQTGKFYYLNNVKHSAGKLSKAELIQLNGFSENLPPTVLGVFETSITYESSRIISVANITDQSNPSYYDPEFDEPIAIKITGGFNPDILIKNGTQVLTTETEILVENWNVTIQDAGNTTAAHSATFTFKIKDSGSGQYSEVEGSINVSVDEYVNNPPVANAGPDQTVQITIGDQIDTVVRLEGFESFDDTGEIISYQWAYISKPTNSSVILNEKTQANASLQVPNTTDSLGTYTLQLTVTDEFGVSDSDSTVVTIETA